MSFNVSNEAKIQLLTQRIEALNLEGYQHELNKKSAESLGNAELTSAIAVHEEELADLA
jgi:hypothetical protein